MEEKKYLIGSKVLGLKNARDIDYVTIDNKVIYKKVFEKDYDVIYISKEYLTNSFAFKSKDWFCLLSNYQYDKNIIQKDFPIKYSILDYRNELITFLKYVVKNKLFNFNKKITINRKYCSKLIYHIAYNTFILQNNSTKLTIEQINKVQLLHDCKMPISYIDELEKIIMGF